ncbi:MAG: DUF5312 domain-containing protein [Treponema sp.]|nr:DUF5312 domain-containing protein [Treponema sp.]
MSDKENFDKLVSDLDPEERRILLGKVKGQVRFSTEPLYIDDDGSISLKDVRAEYAKLPWYSRLWYSFLSLFKGKAPIRIFEDTQVNLLGARISEKYPGLYNVQKGMLLSAFKEQVELLKEASRFFYSALDISVNRDRGAFFAFLGSIQMPDVHERLLRDTEPQKVMEENPRYNDGDLRQHCQKAMEDAIALIGDSHRSAMYFNARSLNCLKEISTFLFDRLIMTFSHNSSLGGQACSAGIVRDLLLTLNNILHSLKVVPPLPLLESLFVFILQERSGDTGFDIGKEVPSLLTKAERALEVIRNFNRRTPLTWIIRCSTKDMTYYPKEMSGGEDWFLFYRDYWKKTVDSACNEFLRDRQHRELLLSFRHLLRGGELKMLEHVQWEGNPEGLPIRGIYPLSFLSTFHPLIFIPEMSSYLTSLFNQGEFLRKENQMEFSEAYLSWMKLEADIKKLNQEISPEGDYGQRYAQTRQEMSALPVKRRKLQIILEEASEEAEGILASARSSSRSICNVLSGILGRESRNKYEPLGNLQKFTQDDSGFIKALDEMIIQFQKILQILDEPEDELLTRPQ